MSSKFESLPAVNGEAPRVIQVEDKCRQLEALLTAAASPAAPLP